MRFCIALTFSATEDIGHFDPYEQRMIVAAIKSYLQVDADVESHRRKRLRPNQLAPWELKVGKYRVFYDLADSTVKVLAVGYKEHNDLFIRGKRVEL
jgi:mRNA-degrading endonuclease RelE of RelBE toxin-antitoxin system